MSSGAHMVLLVFAVFAMGAAPAQATSIVKRSALLDQLNQIFSCSEIVTAGWSPKELTNILIDAMWLPAFPNEETPSNVLTDFSSGRLMQAAVIQKILDLTFKISGNGYLNSVRQEINAAYNAKSSCASSVKSFITS